MPSSKDVAKRAGVSQTTVSRYLNTPDLLNQKTRQKVKAAIEELGYIPNASARSLVSQRTNVITLISGPFNNPFFVDSTEEIINYAHKRGYRVNVHFYDNEIDTIYEAALSNKVDGIIMSCVSLNDPIINRLHKSMIPYICFNRKHETEGHFVELDNFHAGQLAVQHLLELNHKHILWIGGSLEMSTFRNRYAGFRSVVDQYNQLKIKVVNYKNSNRPDLGIMFEELKKKGDLPTAVCAATDSLAIRTLNTLNTMGVSVPTHISVIGIDNVSLSSSPLINLTTVGVEDESQIGLIAIEKLIDQLSSSSSDDNPIRITKSVKLFLRSTTAAIIALGVNPS
ncbi:transcriptional regulator [Taylorella equigenitalis 14/56]|uniref:Transcriptional regulator n=1 Tax=Taylorella equigenitalis 14/56 TaxID=1091497 RepID=I7IBD5_9BURK|nr:LacI family DNA-binding transcriptional regulator [Taylorella equigenitalis]CCG18606.1 transcriptional regulator [Taylorella equigenitalis 14/56]